MIILSLGGIIMILVVGAYSFFILGSLLYTMINIGFATLVFLFIFWRMASDLSRLERERFMFSFIELFVLNFDIQKSVDATLNVIYPLFTLKEQKRLGIMQKRDGFTLLENLKVYFNNHYYDSFYEMLSVVGERGGELMKVSEVLLYSISNSEAQILKLRRIDNTFLIKFLFNWIFIMIVAFIFRFALNNLLNFTNLSLIYLIGHELFLATFLISMLLVFENRIRRRKNVT